MTAPTLELIDSMACARCDGTMVLTPDAVGRMRKRCPRCDGVAAVRRHPDDAQLPQGLVQVKFAVLPPIEPGQLRCQVCAHGVHPALRFCDRCQKAPNAASSRRTYRRRQEISGTPPTRTRTYKPRPCAHPGCVVQFTPTGPRGSYCEAHR